MLLLGDITDGLSIFAAGKTAYEEKVYRDQLFQFILDWVQSSELLFGEKEGIVGLLKRETDMKDSLFRAATKSEFLEALQQLGILNINAQNQAQIELIEKLQQNRFEVGASSQDKILLNEFRNLKMQILEKNQSDLDYQRLLENPIHEGLQLAQPHLRNAGIQQILIGEDGNRSIWLTPDASIQVTGGAVLETFLQNVERGKTAELKVGVDGTEMSYSPPQLKDALGATPYTILRVPERPQNLTGKFLFYIDKLKLKLNASFTHYPDSESFHFQIIGVSNSVSLTMKIGKDGKNLKINLNPSPGNFFTENELPLLSLINTLCQKPGDLRIESIENPKFGFKFSLLELNISETTKILKWTNFRIVFLEVNRLLKAHSIIQEDLPWLDIDDSPPNLYKLLVRVKSVLLNVQDQWEMALTGEFNFTGTGKTQASEKFLEVKTERGIQIAGKCRFVEVIRLPKPQVFKMPNRILLSQDDLRSIWQNTNSIVKIRFEESNAVYSYRALQESDPIQFHDLPIEE